MLSRQQLADIFISFFDDPEARVLVEGYIPHTRLRNFNLATTSLRHIQKWYDRLSNIDNGIRGEHGNYYVDPESLGLVTTSTLPPTLTTVGREFLSTAATYYNNPQQAEYALNKILYHAGYDLGAAAALVHRKRENLLHFLRRCRRTPNTQLVLDNDRLLAIAEILSSFEYALEKFLLRSQTELLAFVELGEAGFRSLFEGMTVHPGYALLANRIGSDYTRASIRRRNYLLSHLFLTIREQLLSSHQQILPLSVPYPFANFVNERIAYETVNLFTHDIRIEPETGGYIVFLEEAAAILPQPTIRNIGLSTRRERVRRPIRPSTTEVRPHPTEPYIVEAPLAVEAENYVERELRSMYGDLVWRIGHTADEIVPLDDGLLPGADIIILDSDRNPSHFIEVKSARVATPSSIRLTASEYNRAVKCEADGLPYDLQIVSFIENDLTPVLSIFDNFQHTAARLTLDDIQSMEIGIALE